MLAHAKEFICPPLALAAPSSSSASPSSATPRAPSRRSAMAGSPSKRPVSTPTPRATAPAAPHPPTLPQPYGRPKSSRTGAASSLRSLARPKALSRQVGPKARRRPGARGSSHAGGALPDGRGRLLLSYEAELVSPLPPALLRPLHLIRPRQVTSASRCPILRVSRWSESPEVSAAATRLEVKRRAPRTLWTRTQAIRGRLGGNLVRALRISRTEMLRAYREATRRNYQANGDIVAGWRWLCAKQARTCAACLAMDGTHKCRDQTADNVSGACRSC